MRKPLPKDEAIKAKKPPQSIIHITPELGEKLALNYTNEGISALKEILNMEVEKEKDMLCYRKDWEDYIRLQSQIVTMRVVLKIIEDCHEYYTE